MLELSKIIRGGRQLLVEPTNFYSESTGDRIYVFDVNNKEGTSISAYVDMYNLEVLMLLITDEEKELAIRYVTEDFYSISLLPHAHVNGYDPDEAFETDTHTHYYDDVSEETMAWILTRI